MTDIFSKEKRSQIMRSIKSKRNKTTELKLIDIFHNNNIIGWRRNYKLFGQPDFVFPDIKIALFTDGCFWHGHNCRNIKPSDNSEFWENKIKRNKKRDEEVTKILTHKGWRVLRIWECEINKKEQDKKLSILKELKKKKKLKNP
jgi:DNA mismatch endonuclease, patch repair protein